LKTTKAPSNSASVHVLGVRHHGPGSARSLLRALEALDPDAVLIEGPPDADALVSLAAHDAMRPPVALLIYRPDAPKQAAYYPFAEFSPEWQALRFAFLHDVPVRFMDLPIAHQFGLDLKDGPAGPIEAEPSESSDGPTSTNGEPALSGQVLRLRVDPLQVLAEAAGFGDGERWWEFVVEHRRDGADLFAAIAEAMSEVRSRVPPETDRRELCREAHMRQTIRLTLSEGKTRVAVVCGAWHAPALQVGSWPSSRDDAALLKGLPRVKVAATWVPWTHGRLGYESGYGAGVESPGWYHHLWTCQDQVVNRWMTKVGRLLRDEGLEASSASVIEAVRLSECLSALRDRPLPGLEELTEATRSVLCFGDDIPLRLVRRKLVVGETLGSVPDETPMVPLAQDLQALQKRLRLAPDPAQTVKVLDLREPTDLERSRLLHRLRILGVAWGEPEYTSGKGTYKEGWRLQWQPEFAVSLIEASLWGTTVLDASTARAQDMAQNCPDLPSLTALLDRAILADLPSAVEQIMARLEAQAAVSSDVKQLMDALPPLASLLRYGNVRQSDASMVAHAADGMVARIAIGLPGACGSLDDDAAAEMFSAIVKADAAIATIQNETYLETWHGALCRLTSSEGLHGLVAGRAVRILLDAHRLAPPEVARRMSLSVSTAEVPSRAAAWADGFLRDSGELLLYDDALFAIIDGWLSTLPPETFPQLLPMLRRTFSTFEPPLRRNLGEKAKQARTVAPARPAASSAPDDFDTDRASSVLPLVTRLLGL
jgi:hypothetical protein